MFHTTSNRGMPIKERLLKNLESNDPKTTSATFDNTPMLPQDVVRLIKILQTNSHLSVLTLFDCRLREEDVKSLATAILENKTLEYVGIEIFNDYGTDTKELAAKINEHLRSNTSNHPS